MTEVCLCIKSSRVLTDGAFVLHHGGGAAGDAAGVHGHCRISRRRYLQEAASRWPRLKLRV